MRKSIVGLMNTQLLRSTLTVAACIGAHIAHSANVRFYLAYGDSDLASRNAAMIGSEIRAAAPLKIPPKGQSFTVQIWVQSTIGSAAPYTGGCLFVGFDRGTADGRGFANFSSLWSSATAKLLQPAGQFSSKGIGLPGLLGKGRMPGLVAYAPLAAESWSGTPEAGKTARSLGIWQAYGFGLGNQLWLGAWQSVRLTDLKFTNLGIGSDIYGDIASENGITLNALAGATSRGTFFATPVRTQGNPGSTMKYCLTAKP